MQGRQRQLTGITQMLNNNSTKSILPRQSSQGVNLKRVVSISTQQPQNCLIRGLSGPQDSLASGLMVKNLGQPSNPGV